MIGSLVWMGLSAIAMIYFSYRNIKLNNLHNTKSLKASVFKRVFEKTIEDNLVKLINVRHKVIGFDFDEFNIALNQFKEGISFYTYYDKAFYKKLLESINLITDNIVEIDNAQAINAKARGLHALESNLNDIFTIINDYCIDYD